MKRDYEEEMRELSSHNMPQSQQYPSFRWEDSEYRGLPQMHYSGYSLPRQQSVINTQSEPTEPALMDSFFSLVDQNLQIKRSLCFVYKLTEQERQKVMPFKQIRVEITYKNRQRAEVAMSPFSRVQNQEEVINIIDSFYQQKRKENTRYYRTNLLVRRYIPNVISWIDKYKDKQELFKCAQLKEEYTNWINMRKKKYSEKILIRLLQGLGQQKDQIKTLLLKRSTYIEKQREHNSTRKEIEIMLEYIDFKQLLPPKPNFQKLPKSIIVPDATKKSNWEKGSTMIEQEWTFIFQSHHKRNPQYVSGLDLSQLSLKISIYSTIT